MVRQWRADKSAPALTGNTTKSCLYVDSLATDYDNGEEMVIWTTSDLELSAKRQQVVKLLREQESPALPPVRRCVPRLREGQSLCPSRQTQAGFGGFSKSRWRMIEETDKIKMLRLPTVWKGICGRQQQPVGEGDFTHPRVGQAERLACRKRPPNAFLRAEARTHFFCPAGPIDNFLITLPV